MRDAGENLCFLSRDEGTPPYGSSQEKEVVCSPGPSVETRAGTSSRIKEIKESLAKVCEEKEQMVATPDMYNVANMSLEPKLAIEVLHQLRHCVNISEWSKNHRDGGCRRIW